jgi:hypothetical protein
LPAFKNPDQKVSIWKVIKDSVGQDLSRVTVPVYFNEPLSMLQKFAEVMEYQDLLVKANSVEDEALRLIYVAVFILGQYHASGTHRVAKPFNPILGETFELDAPDFRYFAEQVQHHPPVSACYASNKNRDYEYWSNSHM